MSTKAQQLHQHPKVLEAKKLILEAIREQQQTVQEPCGPQKDLLDSYQQQLEKLNKLRGGALYYPYLSSGFGHGPYVELEDGSIKLDMISGIGVHYFGHLSETYVEAHLNSVLSSTIMQGHLQQQTNTSELLELILGAANRKGADLSHGIISSSGAMANENALKLAFASHPGRTRILAFEKCFHGRTMAMAQVTDKAAYRQGLPLNLPVDYIPFYQADRPEESTKRALKKLQTLLARYPQSHACMMFELIQGEGGFNTAPREFFMELIKVLQEQEIRIWFDEIQTLGRTQEIFAFQALDLNDYAELVTFGKMSQVCGTLYQDHLKPKPGLISQTFTSSSSAIEAAISTFKFLLDGSLYGPQGTISTSRHLFEEKFTQLHDKYPTLFNGPHGHGAMYSFVYADGSMDKSKQFLQDLFKAGVIAFLAGQSPVKIRFLPPMGCLKREHILQVCDIIDQTLHSKPQA